MDQVHLRPARSQDRERVIDLIHELNVVEAALTGDRKRERSAAEAYHRELLDRLGRRRGEVIVAVVGDIVVGAMGFVIDEDAAYVTDDVRRHGTVTDLVVAPEWRSHGIGRQLLEEAEQRTRAAGCRRLAIGALVANDGAERLYRSFGFEPYVSILTKDW
ncbi:GNAT family N-acetyltransferase [Microvirga massiliensis]|uniref:GNAT family N-acetyltransferase n=1 Tax=Microvirga massiliensis TaxID=1033741 RepID=UPI0006608DF1|nr:GNAT family N-acetyltransferase [Microvirga massiliensis]